MVNEAPVSIAAVKTRELIELVSVLLRSGIHLLSFTPSTAIIALHRIEQFSQQF